MTKKQLARLLREYLFTIEGVPMRSVDCDQDYEEELRNKLTAWVDAQLEDE